MQVKVIKEVNGLEVNDILSYNEKTQKYELSKINEEVSDKGYSKNTSNHSYSKSMISANPEFFIFIDNDGNEVKLKSETKKESKKIELKDQESVGIKTSSPIDEFKNENSILKDRIARLEDELFYNRNKYIVYNPFRINWLF